MKNTKIIVNTKIIGYLEEIEDNGGCYVYNVWKNGNRVDDDLYLNCLEDAIELAKESDADEIEAAVWYKEENPNNGKLIDDYFTVWSK